MTMTTAPGSNLPDADPALDVTGHLVVLVHGLGQTEASWRNTNAPDLVDRIEADAASTPVLVRYNTGRSVAANGRDLAALLESTVATWPVDVERLTIIGHSLGGLVARSACLAGHDDGHDWPALLTDLITTGTPHTGAPAEKVANAAAWGLGFARVTRPLARFVNSRSRGIKDLRFGAVRDSDWGNTHPDALLLTTGADHRLPAHIAHHAFATTLTERVDGLPAWLLGDGMVRTRSATTPRGGTPSTLSVTGSVAHFSIQRDPAVVDAIMDIVRARSPR
jgi:pimeloyl-ACP methyl ester carboxylesterase